MGLVTLTMVLERFLGRKASWEAATLKECSPSPVWRRLEEMAANLKKNKIKLKLKKKSRIITSRQEIQGRAEMNSVKQ